MNDTKKLTHDDLRQFTGDLVRYRNPLYPSVIYTPGVKYLADEAEAYWLINTIAAYLMLSPLMEKAMEKDERLETLQFWRLEVKADQTAILTGRADDDVPPFVTEQIAYTDFPLDHIDIWAGLDGTHPSGATVWVLYLPTEH